MLYNLFFSLLNRESVKLLAIRSILVLLRFYK